MSIDSQTVVALLLVAWAGFYVAWRGYRVIFRRRDSGCGGCAKCPTATQTPTNLVTVESLLSSARRQP